VADSSSGLFFPGVYLGIRLSIRMSSMIQAQGQTATVIFDGNFVILQRRGFLARMTVGKGDKKIPIGSISAVQWKPAGAMVNGYIEFSLSGGNESRAQFGSSTQTAVSNENATVFTKNQMGQFTALRDAVESAIVSHQ
jgi:hypothetical protein